jgi:hypothetical protein
MRVTQQIDALEIMGVNSASYLILPKIAALMTMIPFLVIFSIVAGIIGAFCTCWFAGIMNAADLENGLQYCFQEWFTRLVRQELGAGYEAATVNLIVFVTVTVFAFAVYLLQIPFWKLVDGLLTRLGLLKGPFKITVTEKSGERKEVTL